MAPRYFKGSVLFKTCTNLQLLISLIRILSITIDFTMFRVSHALFHMESLLAERLKCFLIGCLWDIPHFTMAKSQSKRITCTSSSCQLVRGSRYLWACSDLGPHILKLYNSRPRTWRKFRKPIHEGVPGMLRGLQATPPRFTHSIFRSSSHLPDMIQLTGDYPRCINCPFSYCGVHSRFFKPYVATSRQSMTFGHAD